MSKKNYICSKKNPTFLHACMAQIYEYVFFISPTKNSRGICAIYILINFYTITNLVTLFSIYTILLEFPQYVRYSGRFEKDAMFNK